MFSSYLAMNHERMAGMIQMIAKVKRVLAYVICLTLFLASLWVLFEKHVEELTGISVELHPEKYLNLPSLTVCSEQPFRSSGYYYLEEDFVKNSFTMAEIFGPDFENNTNVSQYLILHSL